MIVKLLIRFFVCLCIVSLIGSLGYALRSAILDYEPIKISLNGNFTKEQLLKFYYSNDTNILFSDELMKEIQVKPGFNNIIFLLDDVKEVAAFKIMLNEKNEEFNISKIVVEGNEQYSISEQYLKNLSNVEIMEKGLSDIKFKTLNDLPAFIEFVFKPKITSEYSVWGIPINIFVISSILLLFFIGFWWLMSVISLINKDIAESVNKINQF